MVVGHFAVCAALLFAATFAHSIVPSSHKLIPNSSGDAGLGDLEQAIRGLAPTQQPRDLELDANQKRFVSSAVGGLAVGTLATLAVERGDVEPKEVIAGAGIGGLAGVAAHALLNGMNGPTSDGNLDQLPANTKKNSQNGIIFFQTAMRIEFMTDLTGNLAYFMTLVKNSQILSSDKYLNLEVAPNGLLVLGGDLVGGTGDIRIIKALLKLKKRQPNRVFWVLGDRDISTLRYASELNSGETGSCMDVYWEEIADENTPKPWCTAHGLEYPSLLCTTKWMQAVTMDSPKAFDQRKAELKVVRRTPAIRDVVDYEEGEITDEMVIESFRNSVDPSWRDPWMLHYLQQGFIFLRVGDALFVHGGVQILQRGYVPGEPIERDLSKWVHRLNVWKDKQLEEFLAIPTWQSAADSDLPVKRLRGGEYLMDYALPGGSFGRSVVSANFLDHTGNTGGTEDAVEQWFLSAGVQRIFCGGAEAGPFPAVLRRPGGLLVMNGNIRPFLGSPFEDKTTAYSIITITLSTTQVKGISPAVDICTGDKCEADKRKVTIDPGTAHGYVLHRIEVEDERADQLIGRVVQASKSPAYWLQTLLQTPVPTVVLTRVGDKGRIVKATQLTDSGYLDIMSTLLPTFALP